MGWKSIPINSVPKVAGALGKTAAASLKKKITDWMYVLSGNKRSGYLVTVGDPRKSSSKIKARFSDQDFGPDKELKMWVQDNVGSRISPNHVIDLTGLKLVPNTWDQAFVDSLPQPQRSRLAAKTAKAEPVVHLTGPSGYDLKVYPDPTGSGFRLNLVRRGKIVVEEGYRNVRSLREGIDTYTIYEEEEEDPGIETYDLNRVLVDSLGLRLRSGAEVGLPGTHRSHPR
jgi:hypothetical protein